VATPFFRDDFRASFRLHCMLVQPARTAPKATYYTHHTVRTGHSQRSTPLLSSYVSRCDTDRSDPLEQPTGNTRSGDRDGRGESAGATPRAERHTVRGLLSSCTPQQPRLLLCSPARALPSDARALRAACGAFDGRTARGGRGRPELVRAPFRRTGLAEDAARDRGGVRVAPRDVRLVHRRRATEDAALDARLVGVGAARRDGRERSGAWEGRRQPRGSERSERSVQTREQGDPLRLITGITLKAREQQGDPLRLITGIALKAREQGDPLRLITGITLKGIVRGAPSWNHEPESLTVAWPAMRFASIVGLAPRAERGGSG